MRVGREGMGGTSVCSSGQADACPSLSLTVIRTAKILATTSPTDVFFLPRTKNPTALATLPSNRYSVNKEPHE
jgi:hypothetical protein